MEGRKIIQWSVAGIGVALVVGYSYFVLDDFVRGPRIVIDAPMNGFSTTTPAIVVIGHAIHTNNLSVNDAQTAVDLDGNFRSQLILAKGYNIIKVSAKDNYGRIVEKSIEMNLVTNETATSTPAVATTTQATSTINNYNNTTSDTR